MTGVYLDLNTMHLLEDLARQLRIRNKLEAVHLLYEYEYDGINKRELLENLLKQLNNE